MIETPSPGAFFQPEAEYFLPRPHAQSPWSASVVHGRLLAGLAARAIESAHGQQEFQFARFTVDLFRSPPMEPVQVKSELVRAGGRIRVADASVWVGGVETVRASAVMLRRSEQAQTQVWRAPEWSIPPPDTLDRPPAPPGVILPLDMRPVPGRGFGTDVQKQVWLRDVYQLVEGENLSPFVRATMAADLASPLAHSGAGGLQFINADIGLYLHRLPQGEWIGLEVTGHLSRESVAVGQCTLYDTAGAVGYSITCAVGSRRLENQPPAPSR